MSRTVDDWGAAAENAQTHLKKSGRVYSAKGMLSVIDDMAILGTVTQEYLINKHGPADMIATTLGHVTTEVHGRGSVPTEGGWYGASANPLTYSIRPEFAREWKLLRRLR